MKLAMQAVIKACLFFVLVAGACAGRGHADSKKGDVYFGTLVAADAASRMIRMSLININIREKASGEKSFWLAPEVDIAIEGVNRRFSSDGTMRDLSNQRWVWVDSRDGETTRRRVTATNFQSFRCVVQSLKPDQAVVKLSKIRIGHRYWNQPAKRAPRAFHIPPSVSCEFEGQPASLSAIEPGMELDILTERDVVVKVTIIN